MFHLGIAGRPEGLYGSLVHILSRRGIFVFVACPAWVKGL